jgi:hypothetical protein
MRAEMNKELNVTDAKELDDMADRVRSDARSLLRRGDSIHTSRHWYSEEDETPEEYRRTLSDTPVPESTREKLEKRQDDPVARLRRVAPGTPSFFSRVTLLNIAGVDADDDAEEHLVAWLITGLLYIIPFMVIIPLIITASVWFSLIIPIWFLGFPAFMRFRDLRNPLALTAEEVRWLSTSVETFDLSSPIVRSGDTVPNHIHEVLPVLAAETLDSISKTSAWASPLCDTDRIQLNILGEMRDILDTCDNLSDLKKAIGNSNPVGKSDAVKELRSHLRHLTELYDAGVDTVTRRVAALRVYLSRVQVLSITIDNIAQVDKLIAVSDAASVVGDIVKGQTAIESVSDMNRVWKSYANA